MKFIPSAFVFTVQVVIAPKIFIQVPSSAEYVSVDSSGQVECWYDDRPRLVKGCWSVTDRDEGSHFLGTLESENKIEPVLIELYPVQKVIQ